MKKLVMTTAFASMIALIAAPALAEEADAGTTVEGGMEQQRMPMPVIKRDHLFEERAGTWKATCDEMEDKQVYCRIFHIEQFGEWKTKNFVQLGIAWSPEAVGLVVATYLGFKEGTTVTVGIDTHERHKLTAPKGNNLMLSPEATAKILKEMEAGNRIVVTFNSHSGVRHLSLADLGPFKTLLAKVKKQMAKNSPPEKAE